MKQTHDPRHLQRIKRFKTLFATGFSQTQFNPRVDKLITMHAPEWPINKLNKIDLAILRLAISELLAPNPAPVKVIIDEAIEIGKTFGTVKTPKFVNGVLNSIIQSHET